MDKPNPPSALAPSEIIPAMVKIISKFQHMQENIINTVTQSSTCFANVFQPWAEVANETQGQPGMVWLLSYAAPDQEIHDAVNAADRLFDDAVVDWTSRTGLFALLQAAANKNEELDPESRLWIHSKLRDSISAGHGLADEKTIKQYLSKRSVIDQMRKQYNNNLRNNNAGLWIDESDLSGVPESDMKSWTVGRDENEGKRFVPFANGGYKTQLYEILTLPRHSSSRRFRRDAEHSIGELMLESRDSEPTELSLYASQRELFYLRGVKKYPEAPGPHAQISDDLLETIAKSRNTHRGLRLLHILRASRALVHCGSSKRISLILQDTF